ncbi:hypothetical protein [Microbacterium sp.]|uniref:hypothetical protein n=1 Tax=Actinomycetes TaxID=1760 RepID=UPI0037C8178E
MVYGDGIYGDGIYGTSGTITPTLPRPTRLLYPNVTVEIDGDAYAVAADTQITLDAGAVPYAAAEVQLPLLDEAVLDLLDPRAGDVRCPVTGSDGLVGGPREFDLGLREREIDHVTKTVTLRLASDEALLMDYAPLADDPTPRTLETSLRDVCDYVLDKIGAHLEPGTQDADVSAFWEVTNYFPNAGSENSSELGWVPSTGAPVLTSQTTPVKSGARNVRIQATAASAWIAAEKAISATPGRTYRASLQLRSSVARSVQIMLQWAGPDGLLGMNSNGPTLTSSTSAWTEYTVEGVAPPAATQVRLFVITSGNAAGNFHYIDEVMWYQDDEPVPWFSGASADADYTYEWSGDANASASRRIPVIDRPRDALVWSAGQTGWDFLTVLCASAGMTLWCDEQRRWYLQTPESRTIPALIAVTASNTSEGTDVLSREDPDTYVTGVVCRYFWTDRVDGTRREQVDAAGTPGKVLVREFDNTPYPGSGVAAAMLARRAGTGRAQTVTTITRWDIAPGMTANLTLPAAPETTARISAVTFHPAGFMELRHAGLVDLIPGSIAALAGTIDSLTGTIDDL